MRGKRGWVRGKRIFESVMRQRDLDTWEVPVMTGEGTSPKICTHTEVKARAKGR